MAAPHLNGNGSQRPDFAAIAQWIRAGARILDLGCGDGTLLRYLATTRQVSGYGVEIEDAGILACVKNGINVIQGNLERGLSGFDDRSFDYVILSQTLQAMKNGEHIIDEMLRVGAEGIVTFPNFGYWKNRWQALAGRMPVTDSLPHQWYDTPNIHLCTIEDFETFCSAQRVHILERVVMTNGHRVGWLPNLLGSLAVYRFERAK
jgi:methionine biosynthesis protein MetW